MQHTAPALKTWHFSSLPDLYPGPDLNMCLILSCHRPGPQAMLPLPLTLFAQNPAPKNYPCTLLPHIPSGSEPFLHPDLEAQVQTQHRFLMGC